MSHKTVIKYTVCGAGHVAHKRLPLIVLECVTYMAIYANSLYK